MRISHEATLKRFEARLAAADETNYDLTLFVNGATDLSARAIANAHQLCDLYLHGHYHLNIVDVHEDHAALIRAQVVAAPTLMKNQPLPVRRVVGDLSHVDKVLRVLELPTVSDAGQDHS